MPITRSRTSSEQSTPENVTAGVASVDKESVVKDLKAAVASPEKAEKAKEITEPTNGTCPRVTDSGDVQPDKVEKGDDNGAAADSVETKGKMDTLVLFPLSFLYNISLFLFSFSLSLCFFLFLPLFTCYYSSCHSLSPNPFHFVY